MRNRLPASTFAGPDRSYPIPDASHARNALARASENASPALAARIRAIVHRRFPGIDQKFDQGGIVRGQGAPVSSSGAGTLLPGAQMTDGPNPGQFNVIGPVVRPIAVQGPGGAPGQSMGLPAQADPELAAQRAQQAAWFTAHPQYAQYSHGYSRGGVIPGYQGFQGRAIPTPRVPRYSGAQKGYRERMAMV
jgi:hypothetical protein